MTITLQSNKPALGTLADTTKTPLAAPVERAQAVVDIKFDSDISLDRGDLALVQEPQASGQRIRHRLLTFKGEWFLDLGFGPDYRGQVFVKNPRIDVVSALLRAEIVKSAAGQFTSFDASFNRAARALTVSYAMTLPVGTVSETVVL